MASYKRFHHTPVGLYVQTVEFGHFFEYQMWGVTDYRFRGSPMAEPEPQPVEQPAKPRKRKSGRRFSKFEREIFATFERTQGYKACRLAVAVIRGEINPWDVADKFPGVTVRPTYANRRECKLEVLDQLLGTYGTEQISRRNEDFGYGCEGYRGPTVDYLNAGDTYAATLCYVHGRARPWMIACWGDFVERYSR